MDKEQEIDPNSPAAGALKEVHLLDYIAILLKWRKLIMINLITVTIVATTISFLLPKWYKATASILPPKGQDVFNPLGASSTLLKNFSGLSLFGGTKQGLGAYNYLAILKSRSAMEAVIRKFDLIKVYDVGDSSVEKAIKELQENVAFAIQDEDYITLDVYDKSPQRAADIANYFVEVLNNISIELGTREARNNREFIEKRLGDSQQQLRDAEDALRRYQEKSGVLIVPDQNNSSTSAIAELYGMKARKEIELAIMERNVTKDNQTLQQLKIELSELNKKIATFPEAGIESFRLYRNVAVQEKIVEFLVPLFEQARIDEQKDIPVILVLDKAMPPEKKERPRKLFIITLALILTFVFSYVTVLLIEGWKNFKVHQPEKYRTLRAMIMTLRLPKVFS